MGTESQNLMVCAFTGDHFWFDMACRMYQSFRRFNPNTLMHYCDFGWFTCEQRSALAALGVRQLTREGSAMVKYKNALDLLLWDFVKDLAWDRVMWIDADTLVLAPLEHLFCEPLDFIGHPGRNENGLITVEDNMIRFATGMFVVGDRRILKRTYAVALRDPGIYASSMPTTRIVTNGFTYRQLNGDVYNFSRDIIPLAEFRDGRISYRLNGETIYPKTAGFSRLGGPDDARHSSPALEQFYEEVICQGET